MTIYPDSAPPPLLSTPAPVSLSFPHRSLYEMIGLIYLSTYVLNGYAGGSPAPHYPYRCS